MLQPGLRLWVFVPIAAIALDSIRRIIQTKRERNGLPLPPGPTQIPFLGNAHSISFEKPWESFKELHAKYGDVVYLRLLHQDVVVLGSQQDAIELLEKRSRIYSDRPSNAALAPFQVEKVFAFTHYGDYWRICRRMFHQTFNSNAALGFRPLQIRQARQLIVNVANSPNQYELHFATFASSTAMTTVYGYEPSSQDDFFVQTAHEYAAVIVQGITPVKSMLLDSFPFLLHVPDWFPGSSLKREANHAFDLSLKVDMLFQYCKERMEKFHEGSFSMVSDNLLRMQKRDESEREVYSSALKQTAFGSILAAEETTSTSMLIFTLAMILHPHVWKRAQADIDAVVGKDRLPDFDDRSALPYIDAIMRETLRWHPALPLGVWHAALTSDTYNGYCVPKGASIVPNTWAICRDERRFPNAETFDPERFLGQDGKLNGIDPADFVFGFGRRICPGRYLADASIWIAIATMLATLDFQCAKDTEGNEVEIVPKWVNGVTHRPAAFPCKLTLRTHVVERTLVS